MKKYLLTMFSILFLSLFISCDLNFDVDEKVKVEDEKVKVEDEKVKVEDEKVKNRIIKTKILNNQEFNKDKINLADYVDSGDTLQAIKNIKEKKLLIKTSNKNIKPIELDLENTKIMVKNFEESIKSNKNIQYGSIADGYSIIMYDFKFSKEYMFFVFYDNKISFAIPLKKLKECIEKLNIE